ncbi:MAG TPA: hypothetical protein VG055_04355 [Planctomycetaceae bacterium]|jgi:hypothetical protein|nr:hypothetical protein [Planctomycetaceae bacterium]
MCEFRNGHLTEADAALSAAMKAGKQNPHIRLTSAFYRSMNLFRQGKQDEARQLATEAASKMTKISPLPSVQKNHFWHDDLIMWMAYKEAEQLLKLQSSLPSSGQRIGK